MWRSFSSLLVVALSMFASLQAQESTTYSRFGLGLLNQNNFIESRAMGGLGASFTSEEGVNYTNPASYASLELISFQGAVTGGVNKTSSNFGTGRTGNVNLSYLAFSMPLKKNVWSTSIGLIPFAQKDYLVVDSLSNSDGSKVSNLFEGSGNLYSVYWGNGFKIKDFSIGFNVGYLFGSLNTTTLSTPLDEDGFLDVYSFSTFESNQLKASGVLWNLGAQYSIPIMEKQIDKLNTKSVRMVVGLAYNAEYNVGGNSRLEESKYSIYSNLLTNKTKNESYSDFLESFLELTAAAENAGTPGADVDTFLAPTTSSVPLRMPTNVDFGFTFVKKVRQATHWKAGFDMRWTPWSKYTGYESSGGGQLADSWRIAVGGEILPAIKENGGVPKSKMATLKYRAGFYYERTPVIVQNSSINEFGINFGLAIPIRLRLVNDDGFIGYRGVHAFALGFEVGSRGTKANNLVKDNFFRINFGVSLNDKWFVKRKYN